MAPTSELAGHETPQRCYRSSIALVDDILRVALLTRQRGRLEQQWFLKWCRSFDKAWQAGDEEWLADLHEMLLLVEEKWLSPAAEPLDES